MKVAILGYGGQGQCALEYWSNLGAEVTVCDKNVDTIVPSNAATQLGAHYLEGLDQFDLLVRTPALHPKDIIDANQDPTILPKVTSVTNEFFRVCPTKNLIGITGTKGKGTTSSLLAKMLEASGKRVHLGGNIGIPPLELLKNDIAGDDWVVLELANFQTLDLKYSPPIAVCLMMVPEHLDWHEDFQDYKNAKKPLFSHQNERDLAIYFGENVHSKEIASSGKAKLVPYYSPPGAFVNSNGEIQIDEVIICHTNDVALLGKHNWQNICAAITAFWQVSHDADAIRAVVTSFSGLEHRLEFVRELDGVKYYDDSFGTTPETALVALQAFAQPKVLIVGGSDKGADFEALAKGIAECSVHSIVSIGVTGPKIAQLVRDHNPSIKIVENLQTMPEIVQTSRELANPGDVVLLSTACASFGLFQNYKDRGEQFKSAVKALS